MTEQRGARAAAAFFDLDKTIIAKSSTLAFGRPFYQGGLINRRAVLKQRLRAVRLPRRRRRPRPDGADAGATCPRCAPAGTSSRSGDRRRDAARDRRPAGLRRGRRPDRGAPRRRPRRRHRQPSGAEVVEPIGEMLGADRVIAHPDGRRRRPLHRRDRVLRLRREQGRGDARAGRGERLRPRRLLRLQRLHHRPADARGRRPPVRRQPGPRAAQGGASSAAGRCSTSPGRSRCRPCGSGLAG